jgi:hypothetical protein
MGAAASDPQLLQQRAGCQDLLHAFIAHVGLFEAQAGELTAVGCQCCEGDVCQLHLMNTS